MTLKIDKYIIVGSIDEIIEFIERYEKMNRIEIRSSSNSDIKELIDGFDYLSEKAAKLFK